MFLRIIRYLRFIYQFVFWTLIRYFSRWWAFVEGARCIGDIVRYRCRHNVALR